MKLRLAPGEVRLRLDDEEIERLSAGERLEDTLPALGLSWSCRLGGTRLEPSIRFDCGHLAFELSGAGTEEWLAGRRIALDSRVSDTRGDLAVTVERDLKRRRRRSRPPSPPGGSS